MYAIRSYYDRLPANATHALRLALLLLRADPAADGGEGVVPLQDLGGLGEGAGSQGGDEFGDGDPHRAPLDALTPLAAQAALRLAHRLGHAEAAIDLAEVAAALAGRLV